MVFALDLLYCTVTVSWCGPKLGTGASAVLLGADSTAFAVAAT
jgi:hypothetical protein